MNSDGPIQHPVAIEDLLVHAEWLRRLAIRLLGEADAEDVVQETLAVALTARPEAARARPWLAEVLRNFARRRWRRAKVDARAVSALATVGDAEAPAPDELLARAGLQRELVDLVLQLEEPYRRTLLLRYYEGKSAEAIARELGVPAGTIRWRLSSGIARLRRRLDQHHGPERWRAMLLPLAWPRGEGAPVAGVGAGATAVVAGAWLAQKGARKLVLGLALAALLAAGTTAVVRGRARIGAAGFDVAAARRLGPHVVVDPLAQARGLSGVGSITGLVLRGDGTPAAGALVVAARIVDPVGSAASPTAAADEHGAFRFDAALPGAYRLSATAPGWRAAVSPVVTLADGGHIEGTLRLGDGGETLSGQVLDDGGGPVPGARVTARLGFPFDGPMFPALPPRTFTTAADAEGRYQLTLEPREYELEATAGGYAPAHTTVAVTRAVTRDLRLQPAARLFGTVVERATGQPVASAVVQLMPAEMQSFAGRNAVSDAEGRFGFDDVEAGTYQIVAFDQARNLVGLGAKLSMVPTVSRADLTVLVEAGQSLAGRVIDPGGKPVAGARVSIMRASRSPGGGAAVESGADGRFLARGLLPGSYFVMVRHAQAGTTNEETTILAGGANTILVTLAGSADDPPGVRGIVYDQSGRPAGGVLVRTERASGRGHGERGSESDEDGRFRIVGVGGDAAALTAWHPRLGFARAPLVRTASGRAADVTLRLRPGARIGGHVTYEDGAPAAGVSVAVTRQTDPVYYDSATTGPDGAFLVYNLAEGPYNVQASRKRGPINMTGGADSPALGRVELPAGGEQLDVKLILPRGGRRITGTVVFSRGGPAPGVRVLAAAEPPGEKRGYKPFDGIVEHLATSHEDGSFVLDDLEDRSYTLFAVTPGAPDGELTEVRAGRTGVRLELPAAGRLAGRVVDGAGRAVTDFSLAVLPALDADPSDEQRGRLLQAMQQPPMHVHDAAGAFAVEGIVAGRYQLRAVAGTGGGTLEVTLAAGEDRQDLRLVAAGGFEARGRVVEAAAGAPIPGVSITVDDSGRDLFATTDETGAFSLTGLIPGSRVRIHVREAAQRFVPESRAWLVPTEKPGTGRLELPPFRLIEGDYETALRTRGLFGVRPEQKEGRTIIEAVTPGFPAEAAGVRAGDELLAIAGRELAGLGEGALMYLLARKPGESNTLTLRSPGGEPRTVKMTALPAASGPAR